MSKYQPIGPYIATYRKYPELWCLLNRPDLIARMKMCSRLGKPAILALEIDSAEIWEVLDSARIAGEIDEVKRLIGSMIRQILEADEVGYKLRSSGTSPVSSWLFASGSRYQARDWVGPYWIHQPRDFRNPMSFCVSRMRKLGNYTCPQMKASDWQYYRRINNLEELESVLGRELTKFGTDWRALRQEVRNVGFKIL